MKNHPTRSSLPRPERSHPTLRLLSWLIIAALYVGMTSNPALADDVDLSRGEVAPPLNATAADGSIPDWNDLRGRVVVISFGDSNHDRCRQAWKDISEVLAAPGYRELPISWIVVLTKGSDVNVNWFEGLAGAKPMIIPDDQRKAFEQYGVIVVPTIVVIDRAGRIAHVVKGSSSSLSSTLQDAVRFGLGRITADEFDALLHPAKPREPTEAEQKAERHLHLAEQLEKRGMLDMAEQQYREAIETDPASITTIISLVELLVAQKRLEEAAVEFRYAVEQDGTSVDAALGLVQVLMVGDDAANLEEAATRIDKLIELDDTVARHHFIRGLLHERQGDIAKAAKSFKIAATLLLSQQRDLADESSDGASTLTHG